VTMWKVRWWLADRIEGAADWVQYRLRFSQKTRAMSRAWANGNGTKD